MLTPQQLAEFQNNGAIVVPGVLGGGWLRRVRDDFDLRAADLLARYGCQTGGDFLQKMSRLLTECPQAYEHIDISLPMLADMAARVPEWKKTFGEQWQSEAGFFAPPSVYELLTHANVVSIATQLLGDDVVASPVQHVRIKPPQRILSREAAGDANISRTMWHQDEAVVTEDARGADILTVWAAVTEANTENGCMYFVAGSHLIEDTDKQPDFGLTTHCPGKVLAGEIYIPDAKINREQMMPLIANPGDVALLHRRTIHGAGANTSDGLRWSFDLRYQKAGTPSGRECFPTVAVSGGGAQLCGGERYRQNWIDARDKIISGEVAAVFNERWNKYRNAQLCA